MLPSLVPRLATDLAVRVFPGVWKLLFKDSLPKTELCPYLFCLFVFYIFSYLLSETMGCFLGADVLCRCSEVVLWNSLCIQMFF